jgi:UDP-N-acetylmuramate dehydrogenase
MAPRKRDLLYTLPAALTKDNVSSLISTHHSLAPYTWFKTGGAARYFAQPTNVLELQEVLAFTQKNSLSLHFIGHGANILISDEGINGMVIRPSLTKIAQSSPHTVTAECGASMDELILFCLNNNLLGLEDFSGIPGTVGGSVYINLHYFSSLLGNYITRATVIERNTGDLQEVDQAWFKFGYNTSTLHAETHYLVNATFQLTPCSDQEVAYAQGRRAEIIRHRTARYPNKLTCGSFFRNFTEHEVTLISNGKKVIWVAYYLDKVGVKGELKVGGAMVSYQHANMIVNADNATSSDVINVARLMQEKVREQFNIVPQPECRLLGFNHYPLHS